MSCVNDVGAFIPFGFDGVLCCSCRMFSKGSLTRTFMGIFGLRR